MRYPHSVNGHVWWLISELHTQITNCSNEVLDTLNFQGKNGVQMANFKLRLCEQMPQTPGHTGGM